MLLEMLLVSLTLLQGGMHEGVFEQTFFADAVVNVTAYNSTFDNCTGKVNAIGALSIFSRFDGEIRAENAEIFIKESNVTVVCVNSTVTVLKSRLNISLKNCVFKASLNEIARLDVLDDEMEFSRMENLPLVYSYKGNRFWTYVGNYWPNQNLELVDRNKDGLTDYSVCPRTKLPQYGEGSLLCEPALVESIENYEWHAIEKPPLSVYTMNEEGILEYVGPYIPEEPTGETDLTLIYSIAGIIVGAIAGFLIVRFIRRKYS